VLFHHHSGGPSHPLVGLIPIPFGGDIHATSWLGTFPVAIAGAICVVGAAWLARGINAADGRLVRGLLGPSSMAERVSELERTRALAVDDSAAALRRVERDLHDGAQMRLAALAMNLGMAREKLGDDESVRGLLDAAHRNAVDALADLRDLARGIHPPVLDNGLASALASLAASSAIPATVNAWIDERPAPAIETIAYFCAAELIANATKHSYANQISINIFTERTGVLHLQVGDDGIGGADQAQGTGLAGLAQRVSTVDGRIDVSSPAGGPTKVTVYLPMRAGGDV
jgi:signal transduction histidine kinase